MTRLPRGCALLALAGLLCGCAGGLTLKKAEADPTILTGATGDKTAELDSARRSDESTVRNAVSSADLESLNGATLAWANAETGSRGVIDSIVEDKSGRTPCRRFTTSRERFDGIALYSGEVCMVAPGAWRVQAFAAR